MGKSSDRFQNKLRSSVQQTNVQCRDVLRHEMVSALLLYPLTKGEYDFFSLTSKEKVKDYFNNVAIPKINEIIESITVEHSHTINSLFIGDKLKENFKDNKKGDINFHQISKIEMFQNRDWQERFVETSVAWMSACHHKVVSGNDFYKEKNIKGSNVKDKELQTVTFFDRRFINYLDIKEISSNLTFSKTSLWESEHWCDLVSVQVNELRELLGGKTLTPSKFLTHNLYYSARTALVFGDQIASHESEVCQYQDPGMFTYANTTKDHQYADTLFQHTLKVFIGQVNHLVLSWVCLPLQTTRLCQD